MRTWLSFFASAIQAHFPSLSSQYGCFGCIIIHCSSYYTYVNAFSGKPVTHQHPFPIVLFVLFMYSMQFFLVPKLPQPKLCKMYLYYIQTHRYFIKFIFLNSFTHSFSAFFHLDWVPSRSASPLSFQGLPSSSSSQNFSLPFFSIGSTAFVSLNILFLDLLPHLIELNLQ